MGNVGDELMADRGLIRNTFCGQCGYNLRTRPLIGRCPECGNDYSATPQSMRGIFRPRDLHLPFGTFFLGLICTLIGGPCLYLAVSRGETRAYVPAIPFVIFALSFLWITGSRTVTYVRYRALLRQVEFQTDEEVS